MPAVQNIQTGGTVYDGSKKLPRRFKTEAEELAANLLRNNFLRKEISNTRRTADTAAKVLLGALVITAEGKGRLGLVDELMTYATETDRARLKQALVDRKAL
jgi:ClpP class serine protease